MADRIGVISKGELILVEDKTRLMREARQEAADAAAAEPARAHSGRRSPTCRSSSPTDGQSLVYTFDTQHEETGIATLLRAARRARHRLQGPALERELARGHLRQPREEAGMNAALLNFPRSARSTASRWRARSARSRRASPRRCCRPRSTSSCSARRSARAWADRRRQLRRVHHPGPHHAVAAQREHFERLVRHLPAEVVRHDLRAAVGARFVRRGRDRLRRCGGDEVDHARRADPDHGARVRAVRDRASGLDGRVPAAHVGHVQPVRLHHRSVGRRLPEAAGRSR